MARVAHRKWKEQAVGDGEAVEMQQQGGENEAETQWQGSEKSMIRVGSTAMT